MIRTILTTVIVTLALALMAAFAIAQEPILVNYQGQLNGTDGEPVPDGSYEVSFSLFDDPTEGTLLWMEVHPEVQTSNGMFSVQLGSIEPINLRTFETEILALELKAENDIPMWPRIRLTDVPTAAVAQRVNGDIITEQSTLRIYPPDPIEPAGIQLSAGEEEIGMAIQGIPGGPTAGMAVTLTVDWEDAAIIVQNIPEGGTIGPTVQLIASATMADIMLENLPSPGGPAGSSIGLMANNGDAELTMQALPSPGETGPTVEILVDELMADLTLQNLPSPGGPAGSSISLNSGVFGLAGINMAVALPSGWTGPTVEILVDELMADLTLQNLPSPGEPGPTIALMANSSMADIMLENLPAVGGPAGSSIGLMSNYGEAEINLQALPSPGETGPSVGISADGNGASINIINNMPDGELSGMAMSSQGDGSWSWGLFSPKPEPPGRRVAEMNTGVDGEFSWVMFSPKPEPPEPIMEMATSSAGPIFEMTAPQGQGGRLQITDPMLQMTADSSGSQINLKRIFSDPGGGDDSTGMQLSVDSVEAKMEMFGPASNGIPSVQVVSDINGGKIGISTAPTNILTILQRSDTDPIADAWDIYSSRRWKQNIRTIEGALEKVQNMRGVSFDWKADGQHDIGLIAEEVGEVIPEVVAYEENGIDARSVDYARLVAVLIEAVKEQQETIEELKAQMSKLRQTVQTVTPEGDTDNTHKIDLTFSQ